MNPTTSESGSTPATPRNVPNQACAIVAPFKRQANENTSKPNDTAQSPDQEDTVARKRMRVETASIGHATSTDQSGLEVHEEFQEVLVHISDEENLLNVSKLPDSPQHTNGTAQTFPINKQQAIIEWSNYPNLSQNTNELSNDYQKCGLGKIFNQNREQFIEGEWENNCLVKLHYAQFKIEKFDYIRLYALNNLYTSSKHNFVARITFLPFSIPCNHFQNIRRRIESKIVIMKILDDDLQTKLDTSREKLKSILKSKQETVAVSRVAQRDIFQLFLLINEKLKSYKYGHDNENIVLLREIMKNKLFSQELLNEAKVVYQDEKRYNDRNVGIPTMNRVQVKFSWKKDIFEHIKSSIASLKAALINALPTRALIPSGPADIKKLPGCELLTSSVQDIQLFSDLELSIQQYEKTSELVITNFRDFTQDFINKLWKLLMTKINNCSLNDPDLPVHTNTVYLQLIKTFLELLNLVCSGRDEEILKVVFIKDDADLIIVENKQNISEIYENRLKFVISLMNHFKPGDVKHSAYNYEFFFFNKNETIFISLADVNSSLSDIPQEYVIWIYYIHKCFTDLFYLTQDECDRSGLYSFLNSLMELFITAARNNEVPLEKVRILANSLIAFGTTISTYFLEQTSVNENDLSLLLQQADYLQQFVTVNDITNIVDIYQVFWDERQPLFTKLQKKYFLWPSAVDELTTKFNTFIRYIFNSKIYSNNILSLLRSYNEFMRLLCGTDFPWYVKKHNICTDIYVNLIDEKTDSYFVRDTANFIQEFKNFSRDIPQHFLFDLVKNLLNCVEDFLSQSDWKASDKIQAASDLLLLMGRSLINFNKLPNAVDFQHFYLIFTEPFKRVTQNPSDIKEFKRRLGSLENYYKYTMELNCMGVDRALELCKKNVTYTSIIDFTFNVDQLSLGYKVYWDKFNNYIEKYILQSNFDICQFTEKIISKIKPLELSKWDSQYKILNLPKLLAGLTAVWSALVSKDVISQKQLIKPHCIQILCVLRLLGVDQTRCGVSSHLAEVLTGQGKSLVLALLAAILALTGNRVRIVCYNDYLASRDQDEFQIFYRTLNIEGQINYGTFEDMAEEVLNPDINGTKYSLRKFVDELITDELPRLQVAEKDMEVSKTVLLVDEVDVFFTTEFYGNVYGACTTIGFETLPELQIKIWNLTANNKNFYGLYKIILKYIDEIYLQSTDHTFMKIVKENSTFLNNHIKEMILKAISVRNSIPGDWYSRKFKLSDDGLIITVDKNGEHSTISQYKYSNAFMYFKLKKDNFEHQNFENYGYLYIDCGNVSYALLPKDYHTILGVTGTLKQLSDVEMRAVTSYNIRCGSAMPTFFGGNKLKISNFVIKSTETEWIKAILDNILSVVRDGRAVIVFFVDEHTIKSVRSKFSSHLSRYSVLTGNESAEEVASCVEEAGIARKVTIATRRMGRGVDFKSNDSAVESKGGVHVIQTFWSADLKEETQVKGRTARRDHRGSYEAILCREHLAQAGYDGWAHSYIELDNARRRRAERRGAKIAQKIQQSRHKHDVTMEFFKSLYDYNPEKRRDYFNKYPFVDLLL